MAITSDWMMRALTGDERQPGYPDRSDTHALNCE
jgi:hypothetical protein